MILLKQTCKDTRLGALLDRGILYCVGISCWPESILSGFVRNMPGVQWVIWISGNGTKQHYKQFALCKGIMMEIKNRYDIIVRLVLPIAFQQFMLALVGASDAVMLGRLNQSSMSAVSLATQVTFVFNLFVAAFVIGENMYVARYYGKKDYVHISKVVALVLHISCLVAVLFLAAVLFFSENIMGFFTNDQKLITMGSEYLKAVGISYLLSAVAQVYLSFRGLLSGTERELISRFWEKTGPVLLNELVWGGGFTMYSVEMGHLGPDAVILWRITMPLGCICAFALKLPVMVVYFVLNLDEIVKLPAVYRHYKKYKWVRNIT